MDITAIIDGRCLGLGLRLNPKLHLNIYVFKNSVGLNRNGVGMSRIGAIDYIGILLRNSFLSSCNLKELAHIVFIRVIPVLVVCQSLT